MRETQPQPTKTKTSIADRWRKGNKSNNERENETIKRNAIEEKGNTQRNRTGEYRGMPRKDSGTKRGTTAKEYQTRKHTKHSFTVLLNESWTSVSPDRAELLRHASQAKEPETETVISMEDTKTTVRSFVFFLGGTSGHRRGRAHGGHRRTSATTHGRGIPVLFLLKSCGCSFDPGGGCVFVHGFVCPCLGG